MKLRTVWVLGLLPTSIGGCVLWGERELPCELRANCFSLPDANIMDASLEVRLESSTETGPEASHDGGLDASVDGPVDVLTSEGSPISDAADSEVMGCDASKAPGEAPCVIDEQYGVFVGPSAVGTTMDGTRSHPFTNLADALRRAKADHKRVYVCDDGTGYGALLLWMERSTGFRCSAGLSARDGHTIRRDVQN